MIEGRLIEVLLYIINTSVVLSGLFKYLVTQDKCEGMWLGQLKDNSDTYEGISFNKLNGLICCLGNLHCQRCQTSVKPKTGNKS